MEVAPGLHRIDTPLGPRFSSLYLFVGERSALLFDTGVDGTIPQYVLPYLERSGVPRENVRQVVVSHCDVDHYGGLSDARESFPGAIIAAHRYDAPLMTDYGVFEQRRGREFREPYGLDESPEVQAWMREVCREAPIDWLLSGGERIDLGGREVEVLHVPGHSRGHLAVYDPTNSALAVSDAVLSDAVRNGDGTPAFPPTYRFVDSYLSTIDRFESLAADLLLTAHYPTMRGDDGRAFLASSRNFAERLERSLLEVLASAAGPMTLEELCIALNPIVGRWPREGTVVALAFPVAGHLERLAALGAVSVTRRADGTAELETAR